MLTNIQPKIWFGDVCRKNDFPVTDEQLDQIERYVGLLLDWNAKINLVSRKDEENIWQNHILHCASLFFKLDFLEHSKVVDIGTGGGLPGIILKILQPDLQLTLIDATQKKVNAVQEILNSLSLTDTSTQWGRAEELSKKHENKGQFDVAIARAVAPLADLVKWSRPFLKTSSCGLATKPGKRVMVTPPALVAMKGGALEQEISNIRSDKKINGVEVVDLIFSESEQRIPNDKKVVLVYFKNKLTDFPV